MFLKWFTILLILEGERVINQIFMTLRVSETYQYMYLDLAAR